MILELMQHSYLSRCANEMVLKLGHFRAGIAPGGADLLSMPGIEEFDAADFAAALARAQAICSALARTEAPDATYFPRDALTAHLQSLLERYFTDHRLIQTRTAAGALAGAHPVSDVSLAAGVADQAPDRLFGKMSQSDIGWLSCLLAKAFHSVKTPLAFPDQPAPPHFMPIDARLYLIGDWGSGVARACKIADRIRAMIASEHVREQHVVHLGDVYYSGRPEEYDEHFLAHWPVKPGTESRVGSWALNANHDMFSGGQGYFEHLLKDARFKRQAGSSHFSLENGHWQVLGLDSAFDNENLAGGQFEWVERRHRSRPHQKLALLTHHQPFSAFEGDCLALQRLYTRNTVTAWFWGHEHRFAAYKPRTGLRYGRLVGHGGVPVWARSSAAPVPDSVSYLSTRGFRSGIERFALFGFAVLDFDGPQIHARYIDEYGEVELDEVLA